MTNFCIFDCQYCINRISSDVPRARFSTAEIVKLTLDFYKRNYIEGLFLSSGIIRDSDYTMAQMVEVARCLREDHHFRGYIHLKTIPGAADELVRQAGFHADRLSVNIELPTPADLAELAPEKNRPQLERNMSEIKLKSAEINADRKQGMKAPTYAPAGQSTQMIIGATPSSDQDILKTSHYLYNTYQLRRVYYSAFSPIPHADSRLPPSKPPLLREHRLYQADWMLRFYQFALPEIVSDEYPDLLLDTDPKTAWALRNRAYFPVDVNKASREQLLRIPGLGVRTVNQILIMRRHMRLKFQDMVKLKIALNRAKHFIITADYKPVLLDQVSLNHLLIKPAVTQLALPL